MESGIVVGSSRRFPICFSVQVERNLEKLAGRFAATVNQKAYKNFEDMKDREQKMGSEEIKQTLGLKRKPRSAVFKDVGEDGRVYPGYFAPVIRMDEGARKIEPMRYRVRPAHSTEEIPSKYNVFNARLDSLEKRKTWSSLFSKNHGLFPFIKFYEWVEVEGRKKLIRFNPRNFKIMWAPMIFDTWESEDGRLEFSSFAIITNDPPQEVEEQGHDRCPIFLKENCIEEWLNPKNLSKERLYKILEQKEETYFEHEFKEEK